MFAPQDGRPRAQVGDEIREIPARPVRVLCVDDHRDAADSAAMVLSLYGYEAVACYDGVSALAGALRFGPDVCLIDFNMPGMDGCEVARRLRAWQRGRACYLVAVTAHGVDSVREMTTSSGFDLHLVKPIDWEELREALTHFEQSLRRAELL